MYKSDLYLSQALHVAHETYTCPKHYMWYKSQV